MCSTLCGRQQPSNEESTCGNRYCWRAQGKRRIPCPALAFVLPQVFSLDQELVTDYQGQNLLLKVRNILAVDRGGEQASVPRGVMAPITAFVFDPASGSGIKASILACLPQHPSFLLCSLCRRLIWSCTLLSTAS